MRFLLGAGFACDLERLLLGGVLGEEAVEGTAGLGEQLGCRLDLALGAGLADLDDGADDLLGEVAQLHVRVVDVGADRLPGGRQLLGVCLDVRPALVGELEDATSLALVGADEPLVREVLQRRVDGARALPWPCAGRLASAAGTGPPRGAARRQVRSLTCASCSAW